jgi:hypothetical protein
MAFEHVLIGVYVFQLGQSQAFFRIFVKLYAYLSSNYTISDEPPRAVKDCNDYLKNNVRDKTVAGN